MWDQPEPLLYSVLGSESARGDYTPDEQPERGILGECIEIVNALIDDSQINNRQPIGTKS